MLNRSPDVASSTRPADIQPGIDGPKRVLVVDDDGMVRAFVERALRGQGYATTTAGDGTEALQVAAQLGPFDAMVTDVLMPRIGGYDLARQMRLGEPQIKVLFLSSAAPWPANENAAHRNDGEAFLAKPCTVADLRAAVKDLME